MVRPVCHLSAAILVLDSLSESQGAVWGFRTGRKRLLELLGLVAVLEDKGVELAAAADLELDLLVGVLLHARSCKKRSISQMFTTGPPISPNEIFRPIRVSHKFARPVFPPEFMLFLQSTFLRLLGDTYRKHPCGGRSR